MQNTLTFAGSLVLSLASALAANAQAKDVDLTFVIDQSGSMSDEFVTLSDNIGDFFDLLTNDPGVNSVAGSLITYLGTPVLQLNKTTSATELSAALASEFASGSVENALGAVDSAIPGGESFLGVDYRPNTVRSVILITDEDADDQFSYPGSYAGLGDYVANSGYLLNIITETSLFDRYAGAEVPEGALFDIDLFTADPEAFLADFAQAKLDEIATTPIAPVDPVEPTDPSTPAPVPLPAGLPLLAAALGIFGIAGARRRA